MINISKTKNPMPEREGSVRKNDFEEGALGYTKEMAMREAMRCLKCRKKPCMVKGCPVSNHIPQFVGKVAEGDFDGAYEILMETTSLPGICGRVCAQARQCEGSCVRGVKGQPVSIGAIERFVADYHRTNAKTNVEVASSNGKCVAVIGSGPAGIACAGDLAKQGFAVTIFEKENIAGGVLTYGIPQFRLPKDIVKDEIQKLVDMGVKFEYGKALGKDYTVDSLMDKEGFKAVFVGAGAGVPMQMRIPGEDMNGVISASEYLFKSSQGEALPKAENIAIVGGGNVAMDACRVAVRTGAKNVYVVYRRSEAEMPADAKEIAEAREEGVEFKFLTNPTSVVGSGKVTGLNCVKMELGEEDASGRRSVSPIEGSDFVLDVDLCIMAIGTGFDKEANNAVKSDLSQKGGIVTDMSTSATSRPGVFAGGDIVTGPKTVVHAMGAGKKAAAAIADYLK